jgi:Domain of unknown function (DUF4252)
VREQLAGAGWSPVTQVRSRDDDEKVDIYVCMSHEAIIGLAVVASGKRKFTILNVVGSLDPQKLARIEDRFGLPQLPR